MATILFVDSARWTLSVLFSDLEKRGHTVIAELYASAGMRRLEAGGVDLLVADLCVNRFSINDSLNLPPEDKTDNSSDTIWDAGLELIQYALQLNPAPRIVVYCAMLPKQVRNLLESSAADQVVILRKAVTHPCDVLHVINEAARRACATTTC